MVVNYSIRKEGKSFFVFKFILYTLVGVKYEKIVLVVQYCLKSGLHAMCAMLGARNVRGLDRNSSFFSHT